MSPSLGNTLGAVFIGVVVASTPLQVSLIQAWYYYTHQNDRWPFKTLVSAVMICDVIHQALITHTIYTYLITYFAEPAQLENIVWSLVVEVLFNGIACLLVQSFLTMRVWRLSERNIWVTSIIVFTVKTFLQLLFLEVKRLSIAVNALAAAGDVSIAVVLCTLLHKCRTGYHRSDTVINKLILFTVNTGLLTSLCALASLTSIVVGGDNFVYIAFFFCLGRLYSNSLLATLNARKMFRCTDFIPSNGEDRPLSLRDVPKTTTISSRRADDVSIRIDTSKITESEKYLAGGDIRQSSLELAMDEKEDSTEY
ncbi:hypothetical protein F5887DRAFT_980223 [Amanita rubescens]|nr:hypothetical protein F5887DRAFT_980223 [Amanita rubescens]